MKYLLIIDRDEWKRVLIHMPVGLITVVLGCFVAWWLGPLFGIGFLIYEVDEDWHLRNGAWKDIKGWLWGLGITGLIVGVLKLGGIL